VLSDAILDSKAIEDQNKKPKISRKALIGAAAALLLLVGGGAAAFVMLQDSDGEHANAGPSASGDADSSSYIEVPQVIVNLRSGDGQARFLKLRFILVAASSGQVESIKERLPVLLDALQPFLRELRPEDLNGSAAVFRIKEEMLVRASQSLGTGVVRDVLIQDLVQQ
jgi:flagellar protein FliL